MSTARKASEIALFILAGLSLSFCAKASFKTQAGNSVLTGTGARAIVTATGTGNRTTVYSSGIAQELFVTSISPVVGISNNQIPNHFLCTANCADLAAQASTVAAGHSLIVDGTVFPRSSNGEINFVVNAIIPNDASAPFINPTGGLGGGSGSGGGGGTPPPVLTGAALLGQTIFTNSCAGCHGTNPDFTNYSKTAWKNSVSGGGASMPKGAAKLSAADVANFGAYINAL